MNSRISATCLVLLTLTILAGCMTRPPRAVVEYENYLLVATQKYDSGDYHGARMELNRALKLRPDSQSALLRRASVNVKLDETRAAMADFDLAIALDPENPLAYIGRGGLHRKLKDLQASLRDLERALEIAPELPQSYVALGSTHAALGDLDQAIEDFTLALSMDSTLVRAYLGRANAFVATKRFASAASDVDQVLLLSEDPVMKRSAEILMDRIRPELLSIE